MLLSALFKKSETSVKRGRKPTIPLDVQCKIFQENSSEVLIDNEVAASNSIIYKKIAAILKIKDHMVVYHCAKRFFEQKPKKYRKEKEFDICDVFDDYEHAFSLDIGEMDLIKQFTDSNTDNSRNAYKRGLRSLFREIIWKFTGYICCWQFNILKVLQNEIICSGTCKNTDCSGKVSLTTEKDRTMLRICVKGFNMNAIHVEKSHTTGAHKERIDNILQKNTPYVTRAILASELVKEDGEGEPSMLPTRNTLSRQKYRNKKLTENVKHLHADPVLALALLNNEMETLNCIHNVGLCPFYTMYSTPVQAALLKTESKRSRMVMSIDATGISVKLSPLSTISEHTGKTKRCFLYAINLRLCDGGSIPVYQMLSQDHSSIQISFMLQKFKSHHNHRHPSELVMDESAALLLSSIEIFTPVKSVHEYLDLVYDLMSTERKASFTYIRIDRSHAVKSILRNRAFKKRVSCEAETLYKRLLGFLLQQTKTKVCEDLMRKILTLVHTRYQHSQSITDTIQELEFISSTHKIDETYKKKKFETSDSNIDILDISVGDKNTPKNKFHAWVLSMVEFSSELNESCNRSNYAVNPYYCETLQSTLVEMLSKLPLFGNIMNNVFDSNNEVPTSSPTESDFDVIKNDLFHSTLNIRVDEFVKKHLIFTKGRLVGKRWQEVRNELIAYDQAYDNSFTNKEIQQSIDANNTKKTIISESDNSDEDNTNESAANDTDDDSNIDEFDSKHDKYENFGGLNKDGHQKNKKLHRNRYSILEPKNIINKAIPILPNGFTCTTGRPIIVTAHTCAFDSIFSFYAVSFVDSESCAADIKESSDEFCMLIKLFFTAKKNTILNERNQILKKYYNSKCFVNQISTKVIEINCESTFHYTFNSICNENSSINSITVEKVCEICENIDERESVNQHRYIPTDATVLDLSNLQDSLLPSRKPSKLLCQQCKKNLTTQYKPNKIIVIDTDNPDFKNIAKYSGKDLHVPLPNISISTITNQIIYADILFELRGIIEHRIQSKHFVLYVKRKDGSWQIYDDLFAEKPIKTNKNRVVHVAALLYRQKGIMSSFLL